MAIFYVQGKPLTFNGCTAVLGTPTPACDRTCDNTGRDIELVPASDLLAYIKPETAFKEGDSILYAETTTIEQHLAWILTEFTQKTGILQRKSRIDIQAGVRDYYITPPPGEDIHRVYSVCVKGVCMDSQRREACCRAGSCGHQRGGFVFHPQDKIVLDEATCKECGVIEVQYETFVSNTACTIDKILMTRYQRALVAGAAGSIRKMAGFGWSLPAKGLDLEREFKLAMDRAKIDETIGYTGGMQFVNNWSSNW